jgi:hypothetical protein
MVVDEKDKSADQAIRDQPRALGDDDLITIVAQQFDESGY